MRRVRLSRLDRCWLVSTAFPVALAAAGIPLHIAGMRDQWAFVLWWIAFASGLVLRSPAALLVTAEAIAVFLLALIGNPREAGVILSLGFILMALTGLGILVGKGVVAGAIFMRGLWQGRGWSRPRIEAPTGMDVLGGVALLALSLWSVFASQPLSSVVLLSALPAAIFLLAAIRRPMHLWLLALAVWLFYGLAALIYLRWGHPPMVDVASPNEETVWGSVFESLLLIFVPAWGIAWFGKFVGDRVVAASRGRAARQRDD